MSTNLKKPINELPVRNTSPIKIKAQVGKNFIPVILKDTFGFQPEVIIITKPIGENNRIVVSAVLTDEELAKIEAQKKLAVESKHNGEQPANVTASSEETKVT